MGDRDTHHGELCAEGTVGASCGVTFVPLSLPYGRVNLPGYPHTGAIDALRSVLLDHQPRRGRCHVCRRVAWRRRRFPCPVWFQIGGVLLEHPAERGRHRLAAAPPDPPGAVG